MLATPLSLWTVTGLSLWSIGGTSGSRLRLCRAALAEPRPPGRGRAKAIACARTREAMTELGLIICEERKDPNCVIVSPHSPFLPEAFGVWEGKKLKGSMERFQAPDVTADPEGVDRARRGHRGRRRSGWSCRSGRLRKDWELDRGVTVPAIFLLRQDETKVVPVAISMLGWDEHWLFGTAIANAAEPDRRGRRHRRVVEPVAPRHAGRTARLLRRRGPNSTGWFAKRSSNGRLRDMLDIPQDLCREASECGFAPLLVLGGAFDGQNVKGRVLSYEAPFGIGYLVPRSRSPRGNRSRSASWPRRPSALRAGRGRRQRSLFRRTPVKRRCCVSSARRPAGRPGWGSRWRRALRETRTRDPRSCRATRWACTGSSTSSRTSRSAEERGGDPASPLRYRRPGHELHGVAYRGARTRGDRRHRDRVVACRCSSAVPACTSEPSSTSWRSRRRHREVRERLRRRGPCRPVRAAAGGRSADGRCGWTLTTRGGSCVPSRSSS